MATIFKDKLLLLTIAVFLAGVAAAWLLAPVAADRGVWLALLPALAAGMPALAALLFGFRQTPTPREPYFWVYLALGTSAWLFAQAVEFWMLLKHQTTAGIPTILAPRFFFFIALILAIESLPDRSGSFQRLYANRWVQWSGTAVFLVTLSVYFSLPGFYGEGHDSILLMTASLLFGLDLFLVLAFSYLGLSSRWFRWQVLYFALAASLLLFAAGDCLRLFSGGQAGGGNVPAALWLLNGSAMLALALVGRMKTWDAVISVTDTLDDDAPLQHASALHLAWAYAFVLPVLHLFLARTGMLDPATLSTREAAVLLGMLVLAAIGVMQSRMAERQFQQLTSRDEERLTLKRDRGHLEAAMKERAQRLDMTEQNLRRQIARGHALETDLRQSKARYEVLVETMNEGIGVVDNEERLTYVNQALGRMLGYRAEEMTGHHLTDFFDETGSHIYETQRRKRAKGEEVPFEIQWLARDGRFVPTIMSTRMLLGADNQVSGSFVVITDVTDIKRAQSELRNLANFDNLTNLPNRTLFQDMLVRAIKQASRHRDQIALVLIDLDRFRRINDSLGHDIGDALLKAVSQRLKETTDNTETLARLGSDEFALLLTETQGTSEIARKVESLQTALSQVFSVEGYEITLTTSMGISLFPSDGDTAQLLQKNAAAAVEHAKTSGRDTYQFYEAEMNKTALHRLTLENQLRVALERDQLELFYQPKVDISDGRIVGVEALVRWHHPDLGLITPADFIPLAEESGLIVPLGEWVLERACRQAVEWQKQGMPPLTMAVNLSAMQFKSETLPAKVLSALAKADLQPETLELEITESLAMEDGEMTLAAFGYLKALGVRIAIDDFGTGYSSLSYLRRFPIDTLKIDRGFVVNAAKTKEDRAIVNAIIAMSHGMRLTVIAEGVENKDQLSVLANLGCDQIQGFYVSRPLSAKDLGVLLVTKSIIPL